MKSRLSSFTSSRVRAAKFAAVAAFALLLASPAFAKVNVLILTDHLGHSSAAAGIEAALDAAHVSHARVNATDDLMRTAHAAEDMDAYLDVFEKSPEELNTWWDGYVADAQKARSIGDLYFAKTDLSSAKFLAALRKYNPDVVMTTYFATNEMLQRLKERGVIRDVPVGYIATDYEPDAYQAGLIPKASSTTMAFVPTEAYRERAIEKWHVPAKKVEHTGMPFNPSANMSLTKPQIAELRAELGLDEDIPTIFLGGGSGGLGRFEEMFDSLARSFKNERVQIVAAVGNRKGGADHIREIAARMPETMKIVPLGFTPRLPMIQKYLADVVVTKAGALTSTELLYMRKKMVLIEPAVFMERGNLKYFTSKNLAISAKLDEIGDAAQRLLNDRLLAARIRRAQDAEMAGYKPHKIISWITEVIQEQVDGKRATPDYTNRDRRDRRVVMSCENLFVKL